MRDCNKELLFIETCATDSKHYKKPIYQHCFDRPYCPKCADETARKNALIAYNIILENIAKQLRFNLYAIRFDLTFPHEFDEISEDRIRQLVHKFLLNLRGNDEDYNPDEELGYLYVIHRFGSNSNIFNRHLNVHIYALNAILINGRFRRSRPWANEERAKGIWGYLLQEELGWSENANKTADLRIRYIPFYKVNDRRGRPLAKPYATMTGKHLLTLRYMYRYPVIDASRSILKMQKGVSGRSPVYVQLTSAVGLRTVLESHHRLTWCGFLANSRKDDVFRLLSEKPLGIREIIAKIVRKTCPKCDSPLIQDWGGEEGHTEQDEEREFMQENDWGDLEREYEDPNEDRYLQAGSMIKGVLYLPEWKIHDDAESEDNERARRARYNNW